jgi:hypothetical protein
MQHQLFSCDVSSSYPQPPAASQAKVDGRQEQFMINILSRFASPPNPTTP